MQIEFQKFRHLIYFNKLLDYNLDSENDFMMDLERMFQNAGSIMDAQNTILCSSWAWSPNSVVPIKQLRIRRIIISARMRIWEKEAIWMKEEVNRQLSPTTSDVLISVYVRLIYCTIPFVKNAQKSRIWLLSIRRFLGNKFIEA